MGIEHVEKGTAGQAGRIRAVRSLLAAGVTVLLALGAVSLASAKGAVIHGSGALAHLWVLFALLSFIVGASVAYQLTVRRSSTAKLSQAAQRLYLAVLAVFAILAVALPAAFYLARPAGTASTDDGCRACLLTTASPRPPTSTVDIDVGRDRRAGHPIHLGPLLTIAGIVLGLLVLAAALYIVVRLLRAPRPEPVEGFAGPAEEITDDAELERAMLAGRGALEGEARAAIIACYAAMEESLSAAGLPRLHSDSPADLLARAAGRGLIAGGAAGRLAELFREARYSTHAMTPRHLTDARAALDEILAQVTARQEAAAAQAVSG